MVILAITILTTTFSGSPSLLNDTHCTTVSPPNSGSSLRSRIALVDTLSNDLPSPSFVQTIRIVADKAGFALDYYEANSSTLELFLNLPRMNYTIVVFRTHGWEAVLTTSDPYSQQTYVIDQLLGRVGAQRVNQTVYFAMTPSTVTSLMCGRFSGTIIMAMGCSTMSRTDLADAFLRRGARAFIGWDGGVSMSHSELTFSLVIQMLLGHDTIPSTIETAMHQIGPDPWHGGKLRYYPAIGG